MAVNWRVKVIKNKCEKTGKNLKISRKKVATKLKKIKKKLFLAGTATVASAVVTAVRQPSQAVVVSRQTRSRRETKLDEEWKTVQEVGETV